MWYYAAVTEASVGHTFTELTGIERCTFAGWITRVNFDPGAKISIRPEGGSGRYAAELRTTGKGRVYLFEYIKPPATGAYRVTAHFKNLSGNAKPYISVFDTSPGAKLLLRKDYPTPPADRFEKLTFDFTLDKQSRRDLRRRRRQRRRPA